MSANISNLYGGLFILTMGLLSIIFYKKFGETMATWNYRVFNIKYPIRYCQIGYLIFGLIFIVFGILALAGIIQFNNAPGFSSIGANKPAPIIGYILSVAGSLSLIFHRTLGSRVTAWNGKIFGIECSEKYNQRSLFFIGGFFLVMGILLLKESYF